MSKRRSEQYKKLPQNLYCTGGYFSYKHPITKKHVGLGRNKVSAVRSANAANRMLRANTLLKRHAECLIDLLGHDEIVHAAMARTTLCGVYFLVKDSRVVYVGQSANIHMRLANHIGKKDFDSFHFIECDASILDEVEAAYIVSLDPPLNRVVSLAKAREAMGAPGQKNSTAQADVKTGDSQGLTGRSDWHGSAAQNQ